MKDAPGKLLACAGLFALVGVIVAFGDTLRLIAQALP